MKVGGQLHAATELAKWKAPLAYTTGRWVGPRTGLNAASN